MLNRKWALDRVVTKVKNHLQLGGGGNRDRLGLAKKSDIFLFRREEAGILGLSSVQCFL